jgi:hypothetical protein
MKNVDPLAGLTNELKRHQKEIDNEAASRLKAIGNSLAIIKANIEWLSANKGRIARPPHSRLSDYTDAGLSRFGDQLIEQGSTLATVGQSMKANLLQAFGEPEAIKRLQVTAGLPAGYQQSTGSS